MNKKLREEAEARLQKMEQTTGELDKEEIRSIFHELKVHQIELEIQNEELRNTQEVLEKTKEKYINLYNNAPVGYLTVNSAAIIQQCNETFMRMTGRKDGTVQGKSLSELIHPKDRKLFFGRFRAFLNDPAGKDMDLRLLQPEEQPLPVRLTGSPGDGSSLLIIVSNIREQKIAENRIQGLLNEKELLLREVHHRIKNNMSTISSLLLLQSYSVKEGAAAEALQEAQKRVKTMMVLYEDLYQGTDFNIIDVKSYLENLLNNIEESYTDRREITLSGAFSQLKINDKDALALGIIMNELIANAYKYAFADRQKGEVSISLKKEGNNSYTLRVADNGAGFSKDKSGGDKKTGSGFGLTLVETLAQQLDGTFSVRNLDPGSEFCVTALRRD